MRRRLPLVGAVVLGLFAVAILALPYAVSLESTKSRILAAAESALHRKVEAGAIRLEILSGLGAGIEKAAVRNAAGWESPTLLSADRVSVKVAFWPLLARRIEVRRVVLDGVTVTVERDPKGATNIDDLLAPAPAESPRPEPPASASAAALLVSRLSVARGRLLFVDRKVSPGRTVTTSLDELTGEISEFGPSTGGRFDLSARFLSDAGRNLSLKGSLAAPPPGKGFGDAPLKTRLDAKRLALGRLGTYLGGAKDLGILTLDSTLEGAPLGLLKIAGRLALEPGAPASAVPAVEGQFAGTLDWRGGTLAVERSPIIVAGLALAVEGRVEDLRTTPRVDLRLQTPGEVPLERVTGLPGLSGALPASVKLSGRVRLDAVARGTLADLSTQATVDGAPFEARFGSDPVFAAPSVRATLGAKGKGPMEGRVTAPSGRLQKLPFENLVADWTWAKGLLTVIPAARVFGGGLRGRLDADFSAPGATSRLALSLDGVRAQPLVETLTSARNVIAGDLTANFWLGSRGLTWDAVSKTGRGEGTLTIANAELRSLELMPAVARSLGAIGGVAGFRVPPSLESTKFSRLETGLRLADGRLATPGLRLSGRDVNATADGSVGLDRSLDYEGNVEVGPSVVKSLGDAGKYLADAQGSIALPFRVSGLVGAPKVAIEEKVVLDLGRRALARQTKERLGGDLGKVVGDALGDGKSGSTLDILQRLLKAPPPTPTPH